MKPNRPTFPAARAAKAALLVAALLAWPSFALAAAAALALDVQGDVQAGGTPLRVLQELPAATELALPAGSRAVLFYVADGAEYALAGPGAYAVGAARPEPKAGSAAPAKQAAPAGLAGLRVRAGRTAQAAIVMRGQGLRLLQPVDEVVVGAPLTFAWEPAAGAASYAFQLADDAGRLVHQSRAETATLTLPAGVALRPGARYRWSVRTSVERDPREATAAFEVADATLAKRLAAAKPAAGAPFADRARYAALLDLAGARSAARDARRLLATERPGQVAGVE